MKLTEETDQLLRCLMHILGRASMPIKTVYDLVGRGDKQIQAFNLCDGSLSQSEVSKKTKIDQGQLSRTSTRWVENGIAFWIGVGKDARLLHIYPLPSNTKPKAKKPKKSKNR